MSFLETNFTINGESNEDYGIYIVGKDSSTTNQQFGVTSKAVRDKIKYRDEPYSMGFERDIYNIQISMAKIEDDNLDYTYEDRISITRWLKGKDKFVEFISEDSPLVYYLHFNSGDFENLGRNQGVVTFDCEMQYPYAMSEMLYTNEDLSDNTSSTNLTMVNNSNVIDYYYPMMEFTLVGTNTSFKIINHSNNGEVFEFTGLTIGETICIDNLNKRIKSSLGIARLTNFNKKWFNLIYGQNDVEVFGACILDMKYQFPISL